MKLNSKLTVCAMLLFTLAFQSSCKEKGKQNSGVSTTNVDTSSTAAKTDNSIVFVNIDTLNEKYQFAKDGLKKIEAQYDASEREITGKMETLQNKMLGYQQKAQEMTRQQLEEAERVLGTEEQALGKRKADLSESLSKAQDALNKQMKDKINAYLEKLAKENGYKFILSYNSAGIGMLYGDKSLDITNQVIKDLNEAYAAEKGKK